MVKKTGFKVIAVKNIDVSDYDRPGQIEKFTSLLAA
jgi:hypothetical protein